MPQTKKLMILGAGPMQASAYIAARAAGINVIAVDPNPDSICFDLSDHWYQADLADFETLLDIAKNYKINGVMTLAADYPIPTIGRLNQALGFPGIGAATAKCLTDKVLMKIKFAELVENTDWSYEIFPRAPATSSLHENAKKVRVLLKDRPGIIKPIDSSGGRGISYIDSKCNTADISLAISAAYHHSPSNRAIAEPFIFGKEFSAEIIVHGRQVNILAITEKITSGVPFFLETGHNLPANLDTKTHEAIKIFIENLIAIMDIDNTAAHLEFKLQYPENLSRSAPPIVVPIEIGARLGGGYITSHLVPMATGINIVRAAVDIAVGNSPQFYSNRPTRGSAIRFLIPPPGKIHRIVNVDTISKIAGVEEFVCDYQIGETIETIRDATGRKAYVICSGDDTKEAATQADNVAKQIEFVME